MRQIRILSAVFFCALLFTPVVSGAQRYKSVTAAEEATAEARCRSLGSEMLSSNDPAVQRMRINLAITCPDSGAALLAERWKRLPSDSMAILVLAGSSQRLIDGRIADAALDVLQKRSERLWVRVKALEAVAGQLGRWVTFGKIIQTGYRSFDSNQLVDTRETVEISWRTDEVRRGKQPITPGLRQRIDRAFDDIERGGDERYLVLAVGELKRMLQQSAGARGGA